jgi:hypothetical protein
MKTKYVIQFRSGPLKGEFLGRWSHHGWVFTTERLIARAHHFDSMSATNMVPVLLDIGKDTLTLQVEEPQCELMG